MDEQRRSIDVRAFGFVPGSTTDAAPAIRAALDEARRIGPGATVTMPPGDYHVWPETTQQRELYVSNTCGADPDHRIKHIGILIEGAADLSLRAEGARLVVHGRQTALAVLDSSRVRVAGLEIDWAVPTAIDLTVEAVGVDDGRPWRILSVPACTLFRVDGRTVEWLSELSPTTGERYWTGRGTIVYSQVHDPATGRAWRTPCPVFDDVERIERLDERRFRVVSAPGPRPEDGGLVYQLREEMRDHPGMLVMDSRAVSFEDLRIRYLHGFGLLAQNGADLALDRVSFRVPPGTGRVTAGFADFVHCSGVSGRVDIRDCEFDGPHDDPINVHGAYLAVVGVPADDELELAYQHDETAGFPQYTPGERIELRRRDTLELVLAAAVTEVDGPSGRDHDHDLLAMRVRLDAPLPPEVLGAAAAGLLAAENGTRVSEVHIARCSFRAVPTRAILVSTRLPVTIEDCEFEPTRMPCILVPGDARFWWESGYAADVSIARNTFRGVRSTALGVEPSVPEGAPPVHGLVRFEGNTVELEQPPLAVLHGLARFVARDNVLRDAATGATPDFVPIRADAALDLEWTPSADQPPVRIEPFVL